MTLTQICELRKITLSEAEYAIASLQAEGLVTGYVPGDIHAEILPTERARQIQGLLILDTSSSTKQ